LQLFLLLTPSCYQRAIDYAIDAVSEIARPFARPNGDFGKRLSRTHFAVRGLLAKSVAEAARFIVDRGVAAEGGPVLVRLIAQIASRFGVVVTQKLAVQAVPIVARSAVQR
jgi:hypothetical protein